MPVKKSPKAAVKAAAAQAPRLKLQAKPGEGQWQEAAKFRNLMKFRASEACKKALLAHCTSTIPV